MGTGLGEIGTPERLWNREWTRAGASRFGTILRGLYLKGNTGLMGEQGRKREARTRDAHELEKNIEGTAW